MKTQESNNKLIAEFMQWKKVNVGLIGYETPHSVALIKPSDMLFHSDWNWLKPVIKKCWRIANELDISFDAMMERYRFDYIVYGDLDESFESIVEFIKQYNK